MTDQRSGASSAPSSVRDADLRRLADETWDVLIVGGGIVGAGALLDAASRGLKAALVEQDDVASGTSSRYRHSSLSPSPPASRILRASQSGRSSVST